MCVERAKGQRESRRVEPEESGQRVDRWLVSRLEGTSRGRVVRLLATGVVEVNGKSTRKGSLLRAGDLVSWPVGGAEIRAQPDPDFQLCVVYEDDCLVVVDKPAGVPTHPLRPRETGTLASGLVARYPEMASVGHGPREPGLVHRLDNDTSGLLLAARDRETFDALRAALLRGEIDKRYRTIVGGREVPTGSHVAFLEGEGRRVRVHSALRSCGARIVTEVLECTPLTDYCLLEVRAKCAKRHQLRAHLAAIGHPMYGDQLYGGTPADDQGGHALHAAAISFRHPMTGCLVALSAPLPKTFQERLSLLGWR